MGQVFITRNWRVLVVSATGVVSGFLGLWLIWRLSSQHIIESTPFLLLAFSVVEIGIILFLVKRFLREVGEILLTTFLIALSILIFSGLMILPDYVQYRNCRVQQAAGLHISCMESTEYGATFFVVIIGSVLLGIYCASLLVGGVVVVRSGRVMRGYAVGMGVLGIFIIGLILLRFVSIPASRPEYILREIPIQLAPVSEYVLPSPTGMVAERYIE